MAHKSSQVKSFLVNLDNGDVLSSSAKVLMLATDFNAEESCKSSFGLIRLKATLLINLSKSPISLIAPESLFLSG